MRRRRDLVLTTLVCAAAEIAAVRRPFQGRLEAPADLVVINGAVYAADGGGLHEALAVCGNRITALGTNDDSAKRRGFNTEVVDAHGGAVVPGFDDGHTHMLSGRRDMAT